MAQALAYEGTREQIIQQLRRLPETGQYRVQMSISLVFGMFPQLQALTEEDFQSAEWRSKE